jgi:hypothetical protein
MVPMRVTDIFPEHRTRNFKSYTCETDKKTISKRYHIFMIDDSHLSQCIIHTFGPISRSIKFPYKTHTSL